jgi:hypothetical protein
MNKFLASLVASAFLLSGVAMAGPTPKPTATPTHKPHAANYNSSKSNTGNTGVATGKRRHEPVTGRMATPTPTHKP